MGSKKQIPRYDDEFKRNAVDMTIHGKSVRQVASDLGVSENSLHLWRKKYIEEEDGPQRKNAQEQIERMKREIQELKQERDILKKSVAIFLKPNR